MKVSGLHCRVLDVPVEEPFTYGDGQLHTTYLYLLVELSTDEGLQGIGYAYGVRPGFIRACRILVEELGELVVGEDPFRVRGIWDKLARAAGSYGRTGLVLAAIAPLDVALWDLVGKATNQPLYRLLGGERRWVPTYASHRFWRPLSLATLARNAEAVAREGFRALKLRLGGEDSPEKEEERLCAIREGAGPGVEILVDANWNWLPHQAIQTMRRLESYRIGWLEDPVAADDFEGSAAVATALDVPVCAGETQALGGIRRLLEMQAVDIVMVDLLRIGGITPWLKATALAEVWHRPIVPHLVPEIHAHLVAALPHALTVEYMPWSYGFLTEPPTVKDGLLAVPQGPGLGLTIDRAAVERYALR